MDTIFALSSGAPPAAIAIVRISGPVAFPTVANMAGMVPPRRVATLCTLRDGDIELDRALVLTFPGPDSATGEDLAELHLHGGRAVVRAVERALATRPGVRAAQSGEFTRRALLHGRIDLTQAEGLGDLLSAETEYQRRAALATAQGSLSNRVDDWRERLLAVAASLEAEIEFADEDESPVDQINIIRSHTAALVIEMQRALETPPVERLRDGLRIVIAGPPNSGKSTLLNAMADREAAIVSPISGTTRDRIEVPVVQDGLAYVLIDTAGLAKSTADPIEAIGIDRAGEAMRSADLIIWLGDMPPPHDALWIHPRCDLPGRGALPLGPTVSVSASLGQGLGELWREIKLRTLDMLPTPDTVAMNARQRATVEDAARALDQIAGQTDPLIVGEEIRAALHAIDRLTGRADVEAMLDALFARFCIGK